MIKNSKLKNDLEAAHFFYTGTQCGERNVLNILFIHGYIGKCINICVYIYNWSAMQCIFHACEYGLTSMCTPNLHFSNMGTPCGSGRGPLRDGRIGPASWYSCHWPRPSGLAAQFVQGACHKRRLNYLVYPRFSSFLIFNNLSSVYSSLCITFFILHHFTIHSTLSSLSFPVCVSLHCCGWLLRRRFWLLPRWHVGTVRAVVYMGLLRKCFFLL